MPFVPLCHPKCDDSTEEADIEEGESLREKTPCFSKDVYGELPYLLKEMLHWATNQREKDCLLLSLIAVLAGCMYTIYGYYDRKKYSPHLFAFFTAGVCMVLTALRNCENHSPLEERHCLPQDFACAKGIVHCCLKY